VNSFTGTSIMAGGALRREVGNLADSCSVGMEHRARLLSEPVGQPAAKRKGETQHVYSPSGNRVAA